MPVRVLVVIILPRQSTAINENPITGRLIRVKENERIISLISTM